MQRICCPGIQELRCVPVTMNPVATVFPLISDQSRIIQA
jgi:hypothetical protein